MSRTIDGVLKIYYLILAVIGFPANLQAIVILSRRKCGLSTCTTRYLVAMALADLTVIMINALLWYISYYYFPGTFLDIAPVCSLKTVLASASTDCSVWFTVTFSFDRFVAICSQKLKMKYCTGKTAFVVLTTTCILLCLRNIPYYFTFEPLMIIDNVPWLCTVKPSYYTDPGWVGFDWFDRILTPLLPFSFILLINALTVRHILVSSRVRKGLRGQSNGENARDPEMESRRKSVILLFTISGSFIVLWSVYVVEFIYSKITGTDPEDYTLPEFIFQQVGWMLLNLNCGINTFIYGLTQSKFREQVKSMLTYPFIAIGQFMKKIKQLKSVQGRGN
ncbi:probable G-protein coupled receptor 139 [Chiloscyllium punctatum]|uniref:probable G-protein coupled receptor 139 n=1 Tax=Chiloscyllium punctatum TaxID=137246 RepID=UPI003B635AFE